MEKIEKANESLKQVIKYLKKIEARSGATVTDSILMRVYREVCYFPQSDLFFSGGKVVNPNSDTLDYLINQFKKDVLNSF